MYGKEEASRLRQEFWTTFGKYLAPKRSDDGFKINWINYKTRIRHLFFRMWATSKMAYIGIEITHKDDDIRGLYFEQFEQLKTLLHATLGETWTWEDLVYDDYGRPYCRIYKEMKGVNIFEKEQWPELISFFKPRIIALDEFWSNAYYTFLELE